MCFRVFLWTYTYRCLTDQWLGGTHRVRVTGFKNFCCKCLVLVGQCVYACSFMTHGWVSIIDNHWPQTSPSKKVVHILGWMLDANENQSSTLIGAIWLPILLCRRLPHLYINVRQLFASYWFSQMRKHCSILYILMMFLIYIWREGGNMWKVATVSESWL